MALTTDKENATSRKIVDKAKGPSESAKAPDGTQFSRGLFVNEHGAGVLTDGRGRQIEGSKPEKITITKDLVKKYKEFLGTLFLSMQESKKDPATGQLRPDFSATWSAAPEFKIERDLFTMLTLQDKDKEGQLDMAKFETYLRDPSHIMLIEEMLENHLRLRLFGLAVAASINAKGERSQKDNIDIQYNIDRGVANGIWKENIWPWFQKYLGKETVAGRNVKADNTNSLYWQTKWVKYLEALGVAAGVGVGVASLPFTASAAVGILSLVGLGAIPVVYAAATATLIAEALGSSLFNRGLSIDTDKKSVEGLRSIRTNLAESNFLKEVIGIDVNDYRFGPNGELIPNNDPPKTINREKILRESLELVHVRFQYHKEIGIDDEDVDAMLEQAILDRGKRSIDYNPLNLNVTYGTLSIEQTRSRAKQRIYAIYTQDPSVLVPLPPEVHLARNEKVRRLTLIAKARLQYMNELVLADCEKDRVKQGAERHRLRVVALATKVSGREVGGDLVKKDQTSIENEKLSITQHKTVLQGEASKMKDLGNLDAGWEGKDREISTLLSDHAIDVAGITAVAVPTPLPFGTPQAIETSAVEILRRMTQENIVGAYPNELKIGGDPIGPDSIPQQIRTAKETLRLGVRAQDVIITTAITDVNLAKADLKVETDKKSNAQAIIARAQKSLDAEDRVIDGLSRQVVNPGYGSISAQEQVSKQYKSRKKNRDTLQGEITAAENLINRTVQPDIDRLEGVKVTKENDLATATTLANSEKQKLQDDYTAEESKLNGRKQILETARTTLQTLINERNAAKKTAETTKTTDQNYIEAAKLQNNYDADWNSVKALRDGTIAPPLEPVVIAAPPITDAFLVGASVNQVLAIINKSNELFQADPLTFAMNKDSWPASQNGVEARRNAVLHAITEARAEVIRLADPLVPLTITNEHRRKAIEQYAKEIDGKLITLEADKLAVPEKYKGEKANIEATQKILDRVTAITGTNLGAVDFIRAKISGPDFIRLITTDPQASAEERAFAPAPPVDRGYFDTLDLLTGYKTDPNRGKSFEKWSKLLPPIELGNLVCKHLLKIVPLPNFALVQARLITDTNSGKVGSESIINFIKAVADDKLQEVSAYE